MERWLFDWELARAEPGSTPEVLESLGRPTFDPFGDPGFPFFVCFLPTAVSWHAPAYISYFGADGYDAEFCAAARKWESDFGARFVFLGCVTADFSVTQPPVSPDVAWTLAAQLVWFGGSFQGIHRWLAESLLVANEWHLYARP